MPIADWLSYPPPCKIAKQWKWIWTKGFGLRVEDIFLRRFKLYFWLYVPVHIHHWLFLVLHAFETTSYTLYGISNFAFWVLQQPNIVLASPPYNRKCKTASLVVISWRNQACACRSDRSWGSRTGSRALADGINKFAVSRCPTAEACV